MLDKLGTELPVPPERVLLSIRISPEAKARWVWLAEATNLSITKTLEGAGEDWEARTLQRLKPEDREAYLAGTLDGATTTMFDGRRFRRKIGVPPLTTVLSAKVTTETRDRLVRYAQFYKMPLGAVLDRLSINLEKAWKRRRPDPEPEPMQLDPDMAARMQPVDEEVS